MGWLTGLVGGSADLAGKGVGAVVTSIADTVDRFIETPDDKRDYRRFEAELAARVQSAQAEINLADSRSGNLFQAGWRPAIGWACACGLAWQWVLLPFTVFVVQIACTALGATPFDLSILPRLNGEEILGLLSALLGLGALRTYEKTR